MKALLIAFGVLAACSQQPPSKFTFSDITVTLPEDGTTFPLRTGSDAMTANCAGCHSTSMILFQPALTSDQWTAEIRKMKEVYKAPVDPAAEPAILAYLNAISAGLVSPKVAPAR